MKIIIKKELKIDYLTWQLNNNNIYSEDPNRKGDPKKWKPCHHPFGPFLVVKK